MAITFEATYENGVIKPDRPIDLDERSRVRVTVEPQVTPDADELPPLDPTDPLDAVIGIGRSGPDGISLADEHDRIIYGLKKP
jgi:hypothetical protein